MHNLTEAQYERLLDRAYMRLVEDGVIPFLDMPLDCHPAFDLIRTVATDILEEDILRFEDNLLDG